MVHRLSPCRARLQMPESSTFWNHDPPRADPADGRGRRAGGHGDRRVPRRWPGSLDALCGLSAPGPGRGTPGRSRRGRDRTCGVSRTRCHSACRVVIGDPVVLDEVEELDAITIWPHSGDSDPRCAAHPRCPKKARSANSGPSSFLRSALPASLDPNPAHRHFHARVVPGLR